MNPSYCSAKFICHVENCTEKRSCVWNKNFIEGITK